MTEVKESTWDSELDNFLNVLKKYNTNVIFYKGQDSLFYVRMWWRISNIPYSLPYFRFSQLVETGISNIKHLLQLNARSDDKWDDLAPLTKIHNLFLYCYIHSYIIFLCPYD